MLFRSKEVYVRKIISVVECIAMNDDLCCCVSFIPSFLLHLLPRQHSPMHVECKQMDKPDKTNDRIH